MNDRDGSIELRLNTKNVDEALSKVRELYAAIEKANAAATALAKMLDGLTQGVTPSRTAATNPHLGHLTLKIFA